MERTKKEFDVGVDGRLTPTKVVIESTIWSTKDIVDIALRFFGVFAIGVPLVIFLLQRKAEHEKQRQQHYLETFTKLTADLTTLRVYNTNTHEYIEADKRLNTDLYPKLYLIGDTTILALTDSIYDQIELDLNFSQCKYIIAKLDNIRLDLIFTLVSLY